MQHHDEDDEQTAGKQLRNVGTDDDTDNQRNHHRGEGGQKCYHPLCLLGEQLLEDKAEDNGQDDHLDDAEEHAEGIDMDTLTGIEQGEQWREGRGQHRADRCYAHRQRKVALGKIGHDVRGSTRVHVCCAYGSILYFSLNRLGSLLRTS